MSKQPKVEVKPIERGATPDPNNVNKHTQKGGALLSNSLGRRGAFRSIASAGKGVDVPVVYAGNYILEKAVEAGFTEIVNVHVTGNQIVNVVRDDIEPGTPEAIALGIEDNEIGKLSYSPDIDILAALASGDNAILAQLRKDDKALSGMINQIIPYTDNQDEIMEGLPDFEQGDIKPVKQLRINFLTTDDYRDFSELIQQNLTDKTIVIWYPKKTFNK